MKKSKEYSYSNDIIGLPSVFVAVGWFSLFLLWPRTEIKSPSTYRQPSRIVYTATDNAALVIDPPITLPILSENNGAPAATAEKQILDYRPVRDHSLPPAKTESPPRGAAPYPVPPRPTDFQPTFQASREQAFEFPHVAATNPISIKIEGDLKKNGFIMPDFKDMIQNGSSWHITAYVRTGPDGRADEVFLETRTEDSKINTSVLKALNSGHLSGPGRICSGRINITYLRTENGS